MTNSQDSGNTDPPESRSHRNEGRRRHSKTSGKKLFPHGEVGNGTRAIISNNEDTLDNTTLKLPPGPVIQILSSRMRSLVDTFLMNNSRTQTAFRALLDGPAGGYQGPMDGLTLAWIERDICSASLAILNNKTWLIHSSNSEALLNLLDTAPSVFVPRRLEGEPRIINQVVKHPRFKSLTLGTIRECIHLEMEPRVIPHGPGGHHRLARENDIPRLEEYAVEFEKEADMPPPADWEKQIAENRILLGVVEGTIASVAIRGPGTIDRVLIEGVFTFKAFRRRGLARKLVAAIARQAAGRGQSSAAIVRVNNRPMLELLEMLKFQKTADYLIVLFPK